MLGQDNILLFHTTNDNRGPMVLPLCLFSQVCLVSRNFDLIFPADGHCLIIIFICEPLNEIKRNDY